MPKWIAWLFVIGEIMTKGCLALIPVIMARRARYDGLPKAADWLTILVGLNLLHEVVHRFEWMKRFARWYLVDFQSSLGFPVSFSPRETYPGGGVMAGDQIPIGYDGFPADFTPGDEYRLWGWLAALLSIAVGTTLLFGWKRMSGWAKTGLLSAVAFTSPVVFTCLLNPGLARVLQSLSEQTGLSSWLSSAIVAQIASGLATLPEGLLFGIPVVAVLLDLRRGAIREWTWTGRFGAATALLALLTGSAIYWYADLANRNDPIAGARLIVPAVRLVVIVLSSLVIFKRLGWCGSGLSFS